MLLWRIYAGWKYPHIYTLRNSTCKNQSAKKYIGTYIPKIQYQFTVITERDIILQEYNIAKMCNSMNYKEIYKYE